MIIIMINNIGVNILFAFPIPSLRFRCDINHIMAHIISIDIKTYMDMCSKPLICTLFCRSTVLKNCSGLVPHPLKKLTGTYVKSHATTQT